MDRRGFLGFLGGTAAAVGAVGALAHAQQDGDEFHHGGYRVKWREYTMPVNQNVPIGMWLAKHATYDAELVSTTTGQCYPSRAWEVVDLTLVNGWPKLTPFSSDKERSETKERARLALIAHIDAEPPMTTSAEQWKALSERQKNAPRDKRMTDKDLRW